MDMFDRLEDTVNRYEDITAELGNPDERAEQSGSVNCYVYRIQKL